MDRKLEEKVRQCHQCQVMRYSSPRVPLHPWEWPQWLIACVHIDYAGPFLGKMFLILKDSHSEWIDVAALGSATSTVTIEKLRTMFATYRLPKILVSDNGTAFTSREFQVFLKQNGIRHICTAPYHPATNGQAERVVQVSKEGKKEFFRHMERRIARFLFHYWTTPHTTTGVTLAQLMMGRELRSDLSQLQLDIAAQVVRNQQRQKVGHNHETKEREMKERDLVMVRDFHTGKTWLAGTLRQSRGPISIKAELEDGHILRRHLDHIRL